MSASSSIMPLGPEVNSDHPWPGLSAFTEALQIYFHGRSEETDELMRRVRRELLTVLFGQSGLGKTSLLQAGLFPKLRRERFLPVPIRLEYSANAPEPAVQIKQAIAKSLTAAGLTSAPVPKLDATLWQYFHAADFRILDGDGKPLNLVLVLDQFEEFFTLGQEGRQARFQTAEFLEELSDLIENRIPAALKRRFRDDPDASENYDFEMHDFRVLLSLREDFLPDLEGLRSRLPAIADNRMRLTHMNGRQALDAVLKPGKHLFESPAVAEEIVRFVKDSEAISADNLSQDMSAWKVEPWLLSLICFELNNRRGTELITKNLVDTSKKNILGSFYESCLEHQFPEFRGKLRRFIEEQLVSKGGFRLNVPLEDARAEMQAQGVPAIAIEQLVRDRLLQVEPRLGTKSIELMHDRLAEIVLKSREERRAKEAVEQAARADLEKAEAAAKEFQLKALKAREKLARRTRSWTIIGLVALAVMLGIISYFWWRADTEKREADRLRAKAETEKERADAEKKKAEKAKDEADLHRAEANDRTVRLNIEMGRRLMDEGDFLAAVSRYVDAMAFDKEKPEQLDVHQRRLAATIAYCPRVVRSWPISGKLIDAALSADGQRLASADENGGLEVRNARGDLLWEKKTRGPVTHLAFSPDSTRMVTAGKNNVATLWDASTGKVLAEQPHEGPVLHAVFSPNGNRLLTSSDDKTARLWDLKADLPPERRLLKKFDHTGSVRHSVFSADGKRIATVSFDKHVKFWDAASGKLLSAAPPRVANIAWAVSSGADGRFLVAEADGYLGVFSIDAISPGLVLPEFVHAGLTTAALSSDGKWVVTAGTDKVTRITNLELQMQAADGVGPLNFGLGGGLGGIGGGLGGMGGFGGGLGGLGGIGGGMGGLGGATRETRRLPEENINQQVAFSADNRLCLTVSIDGGVRIWDVAAAELALPPLQHPGPVTRAILSPDGSVITFGADRRARLWTVDADTHVRMPAREISDLKHAAASARAERIVHLNREGAVVITGADGRPLPALKSSDPFGKAWLSADGSRAVTLDENSRLRIWAVDTGLPIADAADPIKDLYHLTLSRTGRHMLVAGEKSVKLWGESQKWRNLPINADIRAADFAPDGSVLAIATTDGVTLWNGTTLSPLPDSAPVDALAFNALGDRLATASKNEKPRIWNIAAPEAPAVVESTNQRDNVSFIQFSPSGGSLLTGAGNTAWVWPLVKDMPGAEPTPLKHRDSVLHAAWSHDGRFIATASADKSIRVWDATTGEPVTPFLKHPFPVVFVAFSANGDELLAVSAQAAELSPPPLPANLTDPPGLIPPFPKPVVVDPPPLDLTGLPGLPVGERGSVPSGARALVRVWNVGASPRMDLEQLTRVAVLMRMGKPAEVPQAAAVSSDWHWRQADECEARGQWFAAYWHIDRLLKHEAKLSDASRLALRGRRADATLGLGKIEQALIDYQASGVAIPPALKLKIAGAYMQRADGVIQDAIRNEFAANKRSIKPEQMVSLDGDLRNGENLLDEVLKASALHQAAVWRQKRELVEIYANYTKALVISKEAAAGDQKLARCRKILDALPVASAEYQASKSTLAGTLTFLSNRINPTDPKKAVKYLTDAIELFPKNDFNYTDRAGLYARLGQDSKALEDYTTAIQCDPKSYGRYVDRARFFYGRKNFEKAEKDYSRAIELSPMDEWYLERANFYENWKKIPESSADHDKAIAVNPGNALNYLQRARFNQRQGKLVAAEEDYARAIGASANSNDYLERGRFYQAQWKYIEAERDFTKAIELNSNDEGAFRDRGVIRLGLRDYARAAEDFSTAIRFYAMDASYWHYRAGANYFLKEREAAASDLAKAIALAPTNLYYQSNAAVMHLHQGDVAAYRKDCDGVIKAYEQAKTADAANTAAWCSAVAPGAVKDPDKLVQLAQFAVKAQPNLYTYNNTLGAAYYRAGRFEQAITQLERAMEMHKTGGQPEDWLFLAMAHKRSKNEDDAKKWLAKAVAYLEDSEKAQPANLATRSLTWVQRLELDLLRAEAQKLINGDAKK